MESEKRVRLTLLEEFLKKMRRVNTVSAKRKGQGKAGRHPSLRCRELPFFLRGPGGRWTPSTGDVIATGGATSPSPTFPRFVITFVTMTSCTTKKHSDQGDVTCDPQTGAGVSHMRLRSRLYVSELRGHELERGTVDRGMLCTGHYRDIGTMHTRLSALASILEWKASRERHVPAETSATNVQNQRGTVTRPKTPSRGSRNTQRMPLQMTRLASYRPISSFLDALNVIVQDWEGSLASRHVQEFRAPKLHAIYRP